MAARKNPKIEAAHRERIATSQLINRLNKVALGELEISPVQLKAMEIALRKTLPDLASVEHTGDAIQPFALIPDVVQDLSRWQDTFKPAPAQLIVQASTLH
jgi:hypothetical protein